MSQRTPKRQQAKRAEAPAQKIHRFDWNPEWRGRSLKEVLAGEMPGLPSRGRVLIVINGLVRAGGETLGDLAAPVPEGQPLAIDLRHGVHGEGKPKRPPLIELMRVLHDDADLVVVSKAAGVVVQPTEEEKVGTQPPLVELLKHYWKNRGADPVNPILVHRLDKATSGLMVLAKSARAGRILQKQAAGRTMERRYIAVVEGRMASEKGVWRNWLGVGRGGMRRVVAEEEEGPNGKVPEGALEAITHYRLIRRLRDATVIQARLETGRTHQIRIHCAEAGHPVVGDRVYARLAEERFAPRRYRRTPPAPRMMLHAAALKFQHPGGRQPWLTFRDDPDEVMKAFIESLAEA